MRGDDGRVYYADVMAAQRHVQGALNAGSRVRSPRWLRRREQIIGRCALEVFDRYYTPYDWYAQQCRVRLVAAFGTDTESVRDVEA
jgi:hypothetical protein